jgi:hypothetical protein
VAWVRKRTIPTERPPLVGEVSANFCGRRVSRGQRDGSIRPYSRISWPEPLLFLPSSSSIVLTRLSGLSCRPTTSQKIWYRLESNPDLWICSQGLWPLDHRGGHADSLRNGKWVDAHPSLASEALPFETKQLSVISLLIQFTIKMD